MGQFGPRAGGESPQRAISPRQYLGGHREGILPAGACSQENGQKLLRRQRAGTDGPKPLAGPVVLEVLGKTKRHGAEAREGTRQRHTLFYATGLLLLREPGAILAPPHRALPF